MEREKKKVVLKSLMAGYKFMIKFATFVKTRGLA